MVSPVDILCLLPHVDFLGVDLSLSHIRPERVLIRGGNRSLILRLPKLGSRSLITGGQLLMLPMSSEAGDPPILTPLDVRADIVGAVRRLRPTPDLG